MPQYIDVSDRGLSQHEVGNKNCTVDYCGGRYPKPCKCGGLIHADLGEEYEDFYWLYTKCDRCGKSEDEQ